MKTIEEVRKFCLHRQEELMKHLRTIEKLPNAEESHNKLLSNMYTGKVVAYQEILDELGK